jgi:hypothetical protein
MAGTAMTSMKRNSYGVWGAQATLLGELRRARNDALTKGDSLPRQIPTADHVAHAPHDAVRRRGGRRTRARSVAERCPGATTITTGVGTIVRVHHAGPHDQTRAPRRRSC